MSVLESLLDQLPEEAVWRLEQTCRCFEEARQGGRSPAVEDYLGRVDGAERVVLLRELLTLEVYYRRQGGEAPSAKDYQRRFPDAGLFLEALLAGDGLPTPPPGDETTDQLPIAGPRSRAPIGLPSWPAGETTDPLPSACRFRPLRFHARGGLGEVFVAEDTELRREVALKQMNPEHSANPASRGRFVLEGEITGALEHPGIVPVYGQGTRPDGRPYYAMRFIRGETLGDALRVFHAGPAARFDALEFRQLLNRFVAVCHAIAYAHSRGILHRDLKPANIMLGAFGETLVVDWGVAKVVGGTHLGAGPEGGEGPVRRSVASEAATMGAIGTPAYMSPEQAAGKADAVGPAADVYSLGATLYELLTGRAPFHGNLVEVLAQVERGTWTAPQEANRAVPAALDAICRKAMALQPADRYVSALELAWDVEQWLADEPVAAHREPWGVRARRWARKHPRLVTGGLVLLATAVVGLTVGTVLLERSKREAEESYELAKDGVNHFLREVTEDVLMDEPGMQALRYSLLNEALIYHEAFLKKRPDDPDIRQQLAGTFRLRAELDGELGRLDEGKVRAQRAAALFEDLLCAKAADKELRFSLARSWLSLADLEWKAGEPAAAVTTVGRSVELLATLRDEEPGSTAVLSLLSRAHDLRAMAHGQFGDVAAAVRDNQAAVAFHEQTLQRIFSVSGKTERVSAVDPAFGAKPGFWLPAVSTEKNALRDRPIPAAIRSLGPECWSNIRQLARTLNHRGALLAMSGRTAESASVFRVSVVLWGWMREQTPRAGRLRHGHAVALLNLGRAASMLGRPSEGEPDLQKALLTLEALCEEEVLVPEYRRSFMQATGELGECLLARGRTARAAELLRKAVTLGEGLLAKPLANDRTLRADFARFQYLLGRLEEGAGHLDEAARQWALAGDAQQLLRANAPSDLALWRDLLNTREVLAGLPLRKGEGSREERAVAQRTVLRERADLAKVAPSSLPFRSAAAASAAVLAGLLLDRGRPRDALAVVEEALPDLRVAARADQDRWKEEMRRRDEPHEPGALPGGEGGLFQLPFLIPGVKTPCVPPSHEARRQWASLLARKAAALAAMGESGAAREAVDRAVALAEEISRDEPCHLLDLAHHLALASSVPGPRRTPDPAAEAVRILRDLVASGFEDGRQLKSDPQLSPLYDREDFRALVRDVEAKITDKSGAARKR